MSSICLGPNVLTVLVAVNCTHILQDDFTSTGAKSEATLKDTGNLIPWLNY